MEIIAETFDVVGKVMISYMAISVHIRVRKEHKIDGVVFKHMKREQVVGVIGIMFIVIGYFLHVYLQLVS